MKEWYKGIIELLIFIGFGVFLVGRGMYSSINTRFLIENGYQAVASRLFK